MLSLIVCEGRTDAILLSYYLIETQQWEFSRGKPPLKLDIRNYENEELNWYKKDGNFLAIWGVGGKDNFGHAINSIIKINKFGNQDQMFSKVAILADRDDNEEQEKINELNGYFLALNPNIKLINRNWISSDFSNSFEQRFSIHLACLVIPFDGPGALENFLLSVLSRENSENEDLISKVAEFITTMESSYLPNNRKRLKATFATTLGIMYPEKVFTEVNNLLRSIPWKDYLEFQHGFEILEEV